MTADSPTRTLILMREVDVNAGKLNGNFMRPGEQAICIVANFLFAEELCPDVLISSTSAHSIETAFSLDTAYNALAIAGKQMHQKNTLALFGEDMKLGFSPTLMPDSILRIPRGVDIYFMDTTPPDVVVVVADERAIDAFTQHVVGQKLGLEAGGMVALAAPRSWAAMGEKYTADVSGTLFNPPRALTFG